MLDNNLTSLTKIKLNTKSNLLCKLKYKLYTLFFYLCILLIFFRNRAV